MNLDSFMLFCHRGKDLPHWADLPGPMNLSYSVIPCARRCSGDTVMGNFSEIVTRCRNMLETCLGGSSAHLKALPSPGCRERQQAPRSGA